MSVTKKAAKDLAIELLLVRDLDEAGAQPLRVAFLDRVCSLGELRYRRDTWPITELGASVFASGGWRIRVRSLVIERDTLKVGQTESEHEIGANGNSSLKLRESLASAVKQALVEHFDHEVAEGLRYKGTLLLDPHAGDET